MKRPLTNRLLLLIFAIVLLGCGQKGPLYLPDKPAPPAEIDDSESPDA